LEIIVEKFTKSEKLLQILIKLLNPQILFCKSQRSLRIQELPLNPEKYFANPKKYFAVLLAPAVCHRQRFSAILPYPKWRRSGNGLLGNGVGKEFVIVSNTKYDVLP